MNIESPATTEKFETPTQGFTPLLESANYGQLKERVDKKLRELIEAIEQTGKGGEITLKVAIKPQRSTGAVEVTGDVTIKKPEPPQRASLYFITPEYNLSRHDQQQRDMFLEQRGARHPGHAD